MVYSFHILLVVLIFLYLVLYIFSIVLSEKGENSPILNLLKYVPPAILTLCIAYMAYFKVDDFLRATNLFQISDRCLAINIEIEPGIGSVKAMLTSQGGDAFAYERLVKNYQQVSGDQKKDIEIQLKKIYDNIDDADNRYFKSTVFAVCRNKEKDVWDYKKPANELCGGAGTEEWDDFNVLNVGSQIKLPIMMSWTTRAKSAKLFQNVDYLGSLEAKNLERIQKSNIDIPFKNLIENIKSHYSLVVRKISLDTYKLWACNKQEDKANCESQFVENNIYNFQGAIDHWKNHKEKEDVIRNFKQTLESGKNKTFEN